MYLYILNTLDTGTFIAFIVCFIDFFVILTFVLVKKYVPQNVAKDLKKFRTSLIGLVTATYGIFLGFLVVTLWDWSVKAEEETYAEASYLDSLTDLSLTFPMPLQAKALDAVGQYVDSIINDEWPLQSYGKTSPKVEENYNNLLQVFHSYIPTSEMETSFSRAITFNLMDLSKAHFIRINKPQFWIRRFENLMVGLFSLS